MVFWKILIPQIYADLPSIDTSLHKIKNNTHLIRPPISSEKSLNIWKLSSLWWQIQVFQNPHFAHESSNCITGNNITNCFLEVTLHSFLRKHLWGTSLKNYSSPLVHSRKNSVSWKMQWIQLTIQVIPQLLPSCSQFFFFFLVRAREEIFQALWTRCKLRPKLVTPYL